ncbi:glutamate--cysteine ligase-like [Calliphora vicina]|uniref:glutamate--cysteine ligase-like n=1 Tax=Calliphora vicina TaxID=7373 RepID=UPI00325A8CC9
MGLLPEGTPLTWQETKALSKHVQKHGVQQFINLYRKSKDRRGDPFKWGDEIEYMIIKFNHEKKEAKASCKAEQLLKILNGREVHNHGTGLWRPEYAAYQLESSPLKPFEGPFTHFTTVEPDMRLRRAEAQELLEEDEYILTIVNSLRLGCKDFTYPPYETRPEDPNSYVKSLYIPDEAVYAGHSRFHILSRNIQLRRGGKMQVKLKVFKDKHTKLPIEGSPFKEPDVVMLDTSFGSNLQVTVQGADMAETRYLYDQLAPLCPVIQAITAAAPIYRGYLTDIDNSYYFMGDGSDDRSAEERGLKPLNNDKCRLKKLRWDSIDSYLTVEAEKYNDIELYYDQKIYDHLRNEGVDHVMAQHVAHIFMRDPLLMFSSNVDQNDEKDTGHFDNINTSTWQTLRFKPAIPNTELGWRVEFRPCDIQLTDFENAAVSCFVILLTRVILHYRLNFLMPISKIDENMVIAQKRDACRKEKFWFRKNITKSKTQLNGCENGFTNGYSNEVNNGYHKDDNPIEQNGITNGFTNDCHAKDLELMTVDEIFNGKSEMCPGLIPLTRSYLQTLDLDNETHCVLEKYIRFMEQRSSGEILTNAMWLREQVHNHPEYKNDSVVSESINYDILKKIKQIQDQEIIESKLLK